MHDYSISVYERKDRPGTWVVDVRDPAGGRCRPQFDSEQEARAHGDKVKKAAALHGPNPPQTVSGMVETYLTTQRAKGLRGSTLDYCRNALGPVIEFFGPDTLVSQVATQAAVERFRGHRVEKVGPTTLRHNLFQLQCALSVVQQRGWLDEVPRIELPNPSPPRQEWLRSDEIKPFLDACTSEFLPLAEAAIFFGLRREEVCVAQVRDFDLHGGLLWVRLKPELNWKPKGGKPREVPLGKDGLEIAREMVQRPPDAWAWPNHNGERRTPCSWFAKATKRAALAAGIGRNLTFHDLRRTLGATLIEAGASLRAVQVILGHASIETTEKVYAPILKRWVSDERAKMDLLLERHGAAHQNSPSATPFVPHLRVVG